MATSGTYVTEVPLKGSAEKHYKSWKSENHVFADAIGHHIQNVVVHEGEHDSHGSIRSWDYTYGIHLVIYLYFLSIYLSLLRPMCVRNYGFGGLLPNMKYYI
uniref:AT4G23670 protein n=1 Tax=Arabidopsis thaliana TaxID=3702 RepID=C0Z255_ARATH|nr:AT4G23670 [Arabidopsis thaliana]